MELIDKAAVVAEIEKKIKEYQSTGDDYWFPVIENLKNTLSLINTLEVKEVDIEKKKMEWIEQLCKYFKANYLYVSGHESFISDFRRYAKNLK